MSAQLSDSDNAGRSVEPLLGKRPVDPVNVGQLTAIIDADLGRDDRLELGAHGEQEVTIRSPVCGQVRIFARILFSIIKFEVVVPVKLVEVRWFVVLGRREITRERVPAIGH